MMILKLVIRTLKHNKVEYSLETIADSPPHIIITQSQNNVIFATFR